MGKYRVSTWCSYQKKKDGTFEIYNHVDHSVIEADAEYVRRIFMLDNTTNPVEVLEKDGMDRADADDFVEDLLLFDILRSGRLFSTGLLSKGLTVVSFRNVAKYKGVFEGLVALLSFAFIPAVYHLITFAKELWAGDIYFNHQYMYLGLVMGILVGVLFHEVAHAIVAIACGGWVCEMGISISVIPGAYTLIDTECIRSKWGKVATYLAGVQANIILSALAFSTSQYFTDLSGFLFFFGLGNLELGLINLLCIEGLDGARTVQVLTECESDDSHRTKLAKLFIVFLKVSHIGYWALIALNMSFIFGW